MEDSKEFSVGVDVAAGHRADRIESVVAEMPSLGVALEEQFHCEVCGKPVARCNAAKHNFEYIHCWACGRGCQSCATALGEKLRKVNARPAEGVMFGDQNGSKVDYRVSAIREPVSIIHAKQEAPAREEPARVGVESKDEIRHPCESNPFPSREEMMQEPKSDRTVVKGKSVYTLIARNARSVDESKVEYTVYVCYELFCYLKLRAYLKERTSELLHNLMRRAIVWCEEASLVESEAITFLLPTVVEAFLVNSMELDAVEKLATVDTAQTVSEIVKFNGGKNPFGANLSFFESIFHGRFSEWRARELWAYQHGTDGFVTSR